MKRLLLFVVASALLAGCTLVSPNGAPVHVKSKVHFGLLDPTIPGTDGARVRFITQPVYIVDATRHLTPSSRIVPSPPRLSTVIEQLIVGPTKIEKSAGYTSVLPRGLIVISTKVENQIGYIDFTNSLSLLSPANELLAVGQLVLTAADAGAPRGLVISVTGTVQTLPLPNGTYAELVTPADFRSLLNS